MNLPRVGECVEIDDDAAQVLKIKMIDFKKHYVLQTKKGKILTIPRDQVIWNGRQFFVDKKKI